MPALFNDEQLIPALERLGIPTPDARDYTNDGCWEVIIPGRTDFRFQRMSLMLCLEWALNRGGLAAGRRRRAASTRGDPRPGRAASEVWQAFLAQMDVMVERTVAAAWPMPSTTARTIAPVPLLSALIDGADRQRAAT